MRDTAITAKFEKTVKGVFCAGHAKAQAKRSLKLLLTLVLFLDRAKHADLLETGVGCLFESGAAVKSSRGIVCRLSEELLAGLCRCRSLPLQC